MKKVTKHKEFTINDNVQDEGFLSGGGELGELIRTKDWSKTPLGPIKKWPKSLRTIVRIMLTSQQPIWIGWGSELIKLYNDPYKSIVGGKHPNALGQPASVVWSDIWKDIEPLLRQVMTQDQGTYSESQLLIMERNGYPEETYYTFSYSPVPGDDGAVEGMICANTDDTQRVIGERQLSSLRELGVQTANAKTIEEACIQSAAALQINTKDIPFGMIYLTDQTKKVASLAATIGIDVAHNAVPPIISLDNDSIWPIANVIDSQEEYIVADLDKHFKNLPEGAWDRPPHQAVIMPVKQSGPIGTAGVMIVGLNPYRLFDDDYQRFLQLVSGQIASSIANAKAYQEEKKRAEALAEIDRAKTLFFSNVSHEFRTPLTLMLGPIQDMLNESSDEEQKVPLKVAHRNGLRLQKLVNTLLDFSRLEAGRIQGNYMPTDLASFTADLASNFRSAIEKADMQLVVKTPSLTEAIYVDRDMWEKIVLNLLSNAFKFTFHGTIEVALTESENFVTLKVQDTGEGIPPQDLHHIFERFRRVEGAKSRSFEGSGIGLSLVKELVTLHKGTIGVDSTVGQGTTIHIEIPKGNKHLPQDHVQLKSPLQSTVIGARAFIEEVEQWQAEQVNINAPDNETQPDTESNKPLILLVDDNADMRQYLVRLLSNRFNVKAASNGKEAWQIIQEKIPDLLITDVMMPEMDGFSLMAALKSNTITAHVPVIMLSARAGEEAKIEGIEAGADDYLVKPFNTNELIARVSTIIAANRARQESERHLTALFMQAPTIIAVLSGPEFVFELANPMYLQLVGKDRDIIGKPLREALPEIKGQGFIEILKNVYTTGEPFMGNEVRAKLDRQGTGVLEEVYINFVYQPFKDAKRKIQGVFVQGVDITEQVLARQKVEETQKQLELALSAGSIGIWVWDIQNDRLRSDERFANFFGADPEKAQTEGLPLDVFTNGVHPEDRDRIKSLIFQTAKTGQSYHAEYRVQGADGEIRWVVARGMVERDEQGNPVRFPGALVDITEHIDLEKALEKSEQTIGTVLNNIPGVAFRCLNDDDWTMELISDGTLELTGHPPSDFLKRKISWSHLIHPDDLERVQQNAAEHISKNEPIRVIYRIITADDRIKWVWDRATPIFSDANEITHWIGFVIDITERIQAEEALRKSELKFKTYAEAMPQMAFIADTEGNINYYNQRWYDYVAGMKDTEGWGWQEKPIHHPDDLQRTIDRWTESVRTGKLYEIEYRLRRHDGEYRWHLGRAVPVQDSSGQIEMWLGTNTDIHEQKLAEEALRKSEEYYKRMTDNTPVMTWITQPDGSCTYLNKQWYEYTDQTPETGLGLGWLKPIHPDDVKRSEEIFLKANDEQAPFSLEYRLKGKNGQYRWHLDSGLPKFDDQGNYEGFVGSVVDIHERKITEERLRASEERFRTLADNISNLCWIATPDGWVYWYNSRWYEYTGTTFKEMEREGWQTVLDPKALPQVFEKWNSSLATGKPLDMIFPLKGADGIFRPFLTRAMPVKDEQGNVLHWFGTNTDITERENLAQQKDEFIGIASHELKTPVTSIKGFIQIANRLFKDQSYEMIGNFLKKAEFHVDKLTGLINDLLDVSRIQAGKLQYNFSEFAVKDIVEDCVEQIAHQAKKHRITVHGDMSISLRGDKVRLEQVVNNFLTNAIKYSPEADEVIVDISRENGSLKISVTDFGIGIPEETLSQVFDRFFRVEKNSNQFQGLGLGLYICAEIIERHDGTISVKSTEGKGSTFYFTLPLHVHESEHA